MTPTLIFAIVAMLLAATLYTVAVFGERGAGILKPWHLALFWAGLVFDTTGTVLMAQIVGDWVWDVHSVVGVSAVVLMLVHSTWATAAVLLKRERLLRNFHRFSLHVWALWMVALVSGVVLVALR